MNAVGMNHFPNRKNKVELFNMAIVILNKWNRFMTEFQERDLTVNGDNDAKDNYHDVFLLPFFQDSKKSRNRCIEQAIINFANQKTIIIQRSSSP